MMLKNYTILKQEIENNEKTEEQIEEKIEEKIEKPDKKKVNAEYMKQYRMKKQEENKKKMI